jgi:flagellar protein FlgJ
MANVIPTNAVDLEGLGELKRRAQRDDPSALAEVAVQFEALFIGMMLESARSASLGSGLFDGAETEQYLRLMDRQVALELARRGGFGFARTLTEQLASAGGVGAAAVLRAPPADGAARARATRADSATAATEPPSRATAGTFPAHLPASLAALGGEVRTEPEQSPTPAEFVTALLPEAQAAAATLGVEPKLLLAQAALETGWGRAVPEGDSAPAHNLFGIKAGAAWQGGSVERWTLEHRGDVTAPELAQFRAYDSTAESFADYVDLIASSRRYSDALVNAANPEGYARAVTNAGYATDPEYADKWLAIYHGDRLEQAMRGIDLVDAPTLTTK